MGTWIDSGFGPSVEGESAARVWVWVEASQGEGIAAAAAFFSFIWRSEVEIEACFAAEGCWIVIESDLLFIYRGSYFLLSFFILAMKKKNNFFPLNYRKLIAY